MEDVQGKLHPEEVREDTNVEFDWGKKRGARTNSGVQFYNSFTYVGVTYSLYDCVYFWRKDEPRPDIGKIVKIWETPKCARKVKVVWFFRPEELHNWLEVEWPLENEIILATGEGIGLFNLNPLSAICGKCNVVCTSVDRRNPQAPELEKSRADYIFYRTFDVGKLVVSNVFPDTIADVKVECFFNRSRDQNFICHSKSKPNLKDKSAKSSLFNEFPPDKKELCTAKREEFSCLTGAENGKYKKRMKVEHFPELPPDVFSSLKFVEKTHSKITKTSDNNSIDNCNKFFDPPSTLPDYKGNSAAFNQKREFIEEKAVKICDAAVARCIEVEDVGPHYQISKVSRAPTNDRKKWFKQPHWEERMKKAHELGTLIQLENLDPCYSSSEVEALVVILCFLRVCCWMPDIVWQAFNERVAARVIEQTVFSSPTNGKALVIFKSKSAAESAIQELNRQCLMLPHGRPLIANRGNPFEPSKRTSFVGHLVISKIKFKYQREEMREAVSTSHCSQPNTIEYEMAMEWCTLQEQSDAWWQSLHEAQAKKVQQLRSQLKHTWTDA